MMDAIRVALSFTLGWRWVVLIDHDGSKRVRRAYIRCGQWVASRMAGVRTVTLLPDGRLAGGCYVVSWRPYAPFAPRPDFPSHKAT